MLLAAPPRLMFWAWERPADLHQLPADAGVAFLASTVELGDGHVRTVPRFQPLPLAPGTYRMAVVRIQGNAANVPVKAALDAIADTVRITQPDALQIDFDARASERVFYRTLLHDLRARLGPQLFLSITALVSWCASNSWLEKLPVNEVVPMTFEMGDASGPVETLLRTGGQFESKVCRQSIGISTRELGSRPRRYRRTYVFAYEDWSPALVQSVLTQLR